MKFLCSEKISQHKYKTPEGYLICVDSVLARTGKQEYKRCEAFGDACDNPDEIIQIDRKPEEVFSDETLASFENKPITVEHPEEDVNAGNHNDYSVGFVRDIKRGKNENGEDVMLGTLVITDKQTIAEIENGEHTDISCGYDCDIKDEAQPQQKNIRGNHIALCQHGRAGNAHIVDSLDAGLQVRQVNQGYAIVVAKYWRQYKDGAFVDRIANSLDEARYIRQSLEKADRMAFVIVDCTNALNKKVVDSVKDDFDQQYAKESRDLQNDVKRANDIWRSSKNKTARQIFTSFGYKEDGEDIFFKQNGNYMKVVIFNDFDDIKYYVLKDGKIPAGWTLTRTKWYDSIHDKQYNFEVISENGTISSTSVIANNESEAKIKAQEQLDKEIRIFGRQLKLGKIYSVWDSINDVEPHKGESKEDFISRFMSETKSEYPDEKQRLAVAYSYWKKAKGEDNMTKDGDFSKTTKQGYIVEELYREGGRLHAIVKRNNDYVVALGYDTSTGEWAQGRYVSTKANAITTLMEEKPNSKRVQDVMKKDSLSKILNIAKLASKMSDMAVWQLKPETNLDKLSVAITNNNIQSLNAMLDIVNKDIDDFNTYRNQLSASDKLAVERFRKLVDKMNALGVHTHKLI